MRSSSVFSVTLKTDEERIELWESELSKRKLFVPTVSPPPLESEVEIVIEGAGVFRTLAARVVHAVAPEQAPRQGGLPGVGLHVITPVIDLEPNDSGDETAPRPARKRPEPSVPTTSGAEDDLKAFLRAYDREDMYRALGVDAQASADEIRARVTQMRDEFTALKKVLPEKFGLISSGLRLLGPIESLLCHPRRRLAYDFRHGNVRADERISAAQTGNGPSMEELRSTWAHVFPDKTQRAAELAMIAFESKKGQDLFNAMLSGEQALELDPFDDVLRQVLSVWKKASEL